MFKKSAKVEKTDETVKESKALAKKATKSAGKKAVEAAANKMLTEIAIDRPGAGAAKRFLDCIAKLDKLKEEQKILNTVKRGINGILRGELKVNLKVLGIVLMLRDMEPEDAESFESLIALYKQQIKLTLTEDQKKIIGKIDAKRAENKKAVLHGQGGDTGEEVGTGAGAGADAGIPAKNESVAAAGNVH